MSKPMTHSKCMKYKKDELIKLCKKKKLSTDGTKEDLCKRIMKKSPAKKVKSPKKKSPAKKPKSPKKKSPAKKVKKEQKVYRLLNKK